LYIDTTNINTMVKALSFKGDKKPHKKRKRTQDDNNDEDASASKQLQTAESAAPEDDENWVSADAVEDISGPVVLVLPTQAVSCAAVDQLGKVFTSKIENMVENEPSSAEPHDVRQVWISQRIVGSENSFTFKGHHGR
jgi:protein FRG1